MVYDIIVVGAGPAGLTAALFAERQALKILIIGNSFHSSMLHEAYFVDNYPGIKSISGPDLLDAMQSQLISKITHERVFSVKKKNDLFLVQTEKNIYQSKTVIIATGSKHRKGNIVGEDKFVGKGVSYCITCDGPLFKGKDVVVVGGGDSAVKGGIFLKDIGASSVSILHRRNCLRAAKRYIVQAKERGIHFILDSVVQEIVGSDYVKKIKIKSLKTNEVFEKKVNGIFFEIGIVPSSELIKDLNVKTENEYIVVNEKKETSVPGLYAAGEVTTTPLRQVITACADGAIAATSAYEYIKQHFK